MKIFLGADHAGFRLKERIEVFLKEQGYDVVDEGAYSLDEDDDFPDFISVVAKQVASDPEHNRGIIFGGTGQGEAMAANRFKKIRAAVFYGGSENIVELSRDHNNANIISIGARFIDDEIAKKAILTWIKTPFSGKDKYIRRNIKIDSFDDEDQGYEF